MATDHQEWARDELRKRIDDSGLGITRYARERLIRSPSTVHRWLAGWRISSVVCDYLLGNWRYLDDTSQSIKGPTDQ